MTPPATPKRAESPIYEWPPYHIRLGDPLPLKKPVIERVREALESCGIVSEHAVEAIMQIIEEQNATSQR